MGGLPCAKNIIDQRNALVQVLDCMCASIQLYSDNKQPTEEMEDRFKAACENAANVATKIEAYVSS